MGEGFCGETVSGQGWVCYALHSIPDLCIALAYFSIPLELLYFLRQYPLRLPRQYKLVIGLFASFILACGSTHIFNIFKLNKDFPEVLAASKLITAVISLVTSVILLGVIPEMLKLPVHASALESELSMRLIELNTAKTRVEATDRSKTEFMAFLCHELRNPLHIITSNGEFLTETKMNGEQAEFVRTIDSMTKLMTSIVNDVLDMSKLETGRMRMESIAFDLHSLCTTLMNTSQALVRTKPLRITANIDNDIPRYVIGDPGRLHQVLLNLVSNAIKFTPRGHVDLKVQLANHVNQSQEEPIIDFIVSDSGIGMPGEFIPLLFTPYSQAKLSTVRETGGTGLGLSIAKRIIELMNGTIRVESKVGEGSTFTLTIPFKCGSPVHIGGNGTLSPSEVLLTTHIDDSHALLDHQHDRSPPPSFTPGDAHTSRQERAIGGPSLTLSSSLPLVADNYTLPTPGGLQLSPFPHMDIVIPASSTNSSTTSSPVPLAPLSIKNNIDPNGRIMLLPPPSTGSAPSSASPSPPLSTRSTSNGFQHRGSNASNGSTGTFPTKSSSTDMGLILDRPSSVSVDIPLTLGSPLTTPSPAAGMGAGTGEEIASTIPPGAPPRGGRYNVLVVDDNAMNQKLLVHHMKALGLDSTVAADGLQAVMAVKQRPNDFDLVFMDLCMPVMSGTRATMQLRHMGFTKPVIALTANAQTEDKTEALAAGCNEFATKPIRRAQLAQLLHKFLPEWRESTSQSPSPSPSPLGLEDGMLATSPNDGQMAPNSVNSSSSVSSRVSPSRRKGRSPRSPFAGLVASGSPNTLAALNASHNVNPNVTNKSPKLARNVSVSGTATSQPSSTSGSSCSGGSISSANSHSNTSLHSKDSSTYDRSQSRTSIDGHNNNDDIVLHIRSQPNLSPISTSSSSSSAAPSTPPHSSKSAVTPTTRPLPTSSSSNTGIASVTTASSSSATSLSSMTLSSISSKQ